jgi:hypothetical protein
MLLGIPNDEQDPIINQFNFILLMARSHIYKNKKAGNQLDVYKLLMECKNHLNLEEQIMAAKNHSKEFNNKWQELHEKL